MIKKYLSASLLLILFFSFISFFSFGSENEQEKQKKTLKILYQILDNLHYRKEIKLDEFSPGVYKNHIEMLDPMKIYFTSMDIENLSFYEKRLGEDFKEGNLDFFTQSISIYQKRILEIEVLSKKILAKSFNFKVDKNLNLESKDLTYSKNSAERESRYKDYLQYLTLLELYSIWKKEGANRKKFPFLERQAREKVKEQLNDFFTLLKKNKTSYYFPSFLNVITSQYDPHTNYFSPKDMEEFNLNISGQLQGIGAILGYEKGSIVIKELIRGGPAFKSKKLEVGDKIIKVGQSPKKNKNILGTTLNESISLIRGKKGTPIYLTIERKNEIKEVLLIRDIIEIQETFARSAFLTNTKGNKYGLIYLPEFYFNPSDKKGRNATEDVKKQIEIFKKENIDGLVLDLRNNGGGSLEAAKLIAGFFIKGPVVQILTSNGKKIILSGENEPIWNKPFVVLVNKASASASEIFAGAMQDHKRAPVIGDKQTYGKGTVQNLIEFNKINVFVSGKQQGAIKLTTSKFYRPSGKSTQLKGVTPDIILPSRWTYSKIGEKNQKNPLPWDTIESADFSAFNENIPVFEKIKKKSKLRIKENKILKLFDEFYRDLENKNETIPLNWQKFLNKNKQKKAKEGKFKALENYSNKLTVTLLDSKLDPSSSKEWKKSLGKDFVMEESIEVLKELSGNL